MSNIFIIIFFVFSAGKGKKLSASQIQNYLDDIPSESDVSGADDDSVVDETWVPRGQRDDELSDMDDVSDSDGGPEEVGAGDSQDIGLPVQDDPDVPVAGPSRRADPEAGPSRPAPAAKRRRVSNKPRKVWEWSESDLDPRELPPSKVKSRNMQNTRLDVQYFMCMMGEDNVRLITEQSNIVRVKRGIERNRTFPPISEREIRQWLGLNMYMSVLHMPSTHLHWNLSLRNEAIASVMTRDRFREINSVIHLCNTDLQQMDRNAPDFDRIFKVREFLDNLSAHFADFAEIEAVLSVDEMIVPYKGQLGLKVYMKNKPNKWGLKVWALAGQSGYVYRFNVFGDNRLVMTDQEAQELEAGIGMSGQTVLNLTEDLPEGSELFFDNYFSSPALLLKLR